MSLGSADLCASHTLQHLPPFALVTLQRWRAAARSCKTIATAAAFLPGTRVGCGHGSCSDLHVSSNPLLQARQRVRALGPKRVLVVDDESDARELVKHVLAMAGVEVMAVESVHDALEALSAEDVDLVISDIGMPEVDGHVLIQRMRASALWSAIPAIAVSGFVQPKDRQRALVAGFDAYFGKPCEPATLLWAVLALLRPKSAQPPTP